MSGVRDLEISPRRTLPASLLTLSFSRSGGPGGQNVNKVATKVDLRLDLAAAEEVLGERAVATLRRKLATRIGADGSLRVTASAHRERARNVEAALARMEELLGEALSRRRPRVATTPSPASRRRRLEGKRHRSRIKQGRTAPDEG